MNPAALRANLRDLRPAGAIIGQQRRVHAPNSPGGLRDEPADDDSLRPTRSSTSRSPLNGAGARRAGHDLEAGRPDQENFFALGIMFLAVQDGAWRPRSPGSRRSSAAGRSSRRQTAGRSTRYAFGETTEIFHTTYRVAPAHLAPGTYRNITGNEATALGQLTAAKLADRQLIYASYPITPSLRDPPSALRLEELRAQDVQAEGRDRRDRGRARRQLRVARWGSPGPRVPGWPQGGDARPGRHGGAALVVIDVQRAGPSTGMPTKTEQSDLLQALFGRNGTRRSPSSPRRRRQNASTMRSRPGASPSIT